MRTYSLDDYRQYVPLWVSVILAYVLFLALSFVLIPYNNSMFYPDGSVHYRLTWTHFLLPAVGALGLYLAMEWFDGNYGKDASRSVYFLLAVLLAYFVGYYLGIISFNYTFVLAGANPIALDLLWRLFVFLPYWALLPGLLAAWVVRRFHNKQ